jgi:hypothetical protein
VVSEMIPSLGTPQGTLMPSTGKRDTLSVDTIHSLELNLWIYNVRTGSRCCGPPPLSHLSKCSIVEPNLGSYAAQPRQLWIRLHFVGEGEVPSREHMAENLLLESQWITPADIYSYIVFPNRWEFELCFFSANSLC